ncbi:MAG: hypothetical protein VYE77_00665 [Planctomycetota bacterium]|nr:hypothetical protein [Planctomycetota bacterium]
MHPAAARIRLGSLSLLIVAAATAQAPPGATPPLETKGLAATPAEKSAADTRWQLGRAALANGTAEAALPHLLAALEFHPNSPAILLDLALACQATPAGEDSAAFWLERLVRAGADDKGRFKASKEQRQQLGKLDLEDGRKLARQRALAAAELERAIKKLANRPKLGDGATARWLTEIFTELAHDSPALLAGHGPAVQAALAQFAPDYEAVCAGLLQLAKMSPGKTTTGREADEDGEDAERQRRLERALEAARILAGLARQASFGDDVQGPRPPDLSKMAAEAARAIARHESALGEPRVYTIAELEAMDPEQRDAFTLAHRSWANPAVTVSPTGKYRLETVCGFETLLGAATTVEWHHDRLAKHFGADPFTDRQGTVRIVPEVAELEIEGAPHWWAAGFQGGDRTVIRFAWSNIPAMGRLLTHELTHRFDGVMHPFQRAWYVEGHAVWTGGHYAKMRDVDCVEDFLQVGTCATTLVEGYGRADKLKKLLTGEIEEYRDNYFAGYALYAFLRGYPPKQKARYASALAKFERNGRAGSKDPVGYFTTCFCDGEDGRPTDFDGFVEEWREFLGDCYAFLDDRTRGPENEWVGRYGRRGPGDPAKLAMDEPTWSWGRNHAEPFFGQAHATAAGRVLRAGGLPHAAAAANLWSLSCEGGQPGPAAAARELLEELGREDAAGALAILQRSRFPNMVTAPAPSPLSNKLGKTHGYLNLLREVAAAHDVLGHATTAAALRAEATRLGDLLPAAEAEATASGKPAAAPPPVPRILGSFGYGESSLTGFDDNRVKGLWYETESGDLHVGRKRPREGTGTFDRAAHRRSAFVHGESWLRPGHHVIKARIHFTTSFVNGTVVLGHWRRDRSIRLNFRAGDIQYATGRTQERDEFQTVRLQLRGLWERDGQLPSTAPAYTFDFDEPSSWFDLEMHVRGPSVLVKANGEALFRYTTHDGVPIEGQLGFATSQGAIRVQQPTVQRLDLTHPGQTLAATSAVGLDLERQPWREVDDLLHLPTRGLPHDPLGTLILWIPPEEQGEPVPQLDRMLPVLAKLLRDRTSFPQSWRLLVPGPMSQERADEMLTKLRELGEREDITALRHSIKEPFTGNPWVLFIDNAGLLRAAAEIGDPALHARVQRWARMFRAR